MIKRWSKILLGLLVTIIGLILMPVPGPGGTPVTIAGLAILSTELPWARRILDPLIDLLTRPRPLWLRVLIVVGLIVFWVAGTIVGWAILRKFWPGLAHR